MMDTIMFGIGCFTVGFAAGAMTLVWHATRPNGYLAKNGKRWKLEEFRAAGQSQK